MMDFYEIISAEFHAARGNTGAPPTERARDPLAMVVGAAAARIVRASSPIAVHAAVPQQAESMGQMTMDHQDTQMQGIDVGADMAIPEDPDTPMQSIEPIDDDMVWVDSPEGGNVDWESIDSVSPSPVSLPNSHARLAASNSSQEEELDEIIAPRRSRQLPYIASPDQAPSSPTLSLLGEYPENPVDGLPRDQSQEFGVEAAASPLRVPLEQEEQRTLSLSPPPEYEQPLWEMAHEVAAYVDRMRWDLIRTQIENELLRDQNNALRHDVELLQAALRASWERERLDAPVEGPAELGLQDHFGLMEAEGEAQYAWWY